MIPLILKLKKGKHKEIAKVQDLIIEELFTIFDQAVLHGGTGLWRCYDGNRFSDDIDVYIPKDIDKITKLFESLERKGFTIVKKKIGENSIYSELQFERTFVRFEALFKRVDGVLKEYKTVEGNLITIYTLTPEELIHEKIRAYLARHKIRDLYDLFFLLRFVKDRGIVKKELQLLLSKFKDPVDTKDLQVLIIDGLVPTVESMKEYIKSWSR